MSKFLFVLFLSGVLTSFARAETAPQFLSWEHSLTTRSSKSRYAIARLKIYNNWQAGRHRLLVKYNVSGLGATDDLMNRDYGASFSMPSFDPSRIASRIAYHNGALGIVQNLADDQLVAYSSEAGDKGEYFVQKRKALMQRLRFDPWKKIAPELSEEEVPRLTHQQRRRLGREVRSALRPILRDVIKTYFRALPKTRSFRVGEDLIEARGYRMTALLNAGDEYAGARWLRLSFEWWLAPEMKGDEIARQFFGKLIADYRAWGGPTTSMWMNEMLPLVWASLPQALHQAVSTLLPVAISEEGARVPLTTGFTPLYMAATMAPPKGEEDMDETGTLRLELVLKDRSTRDLSKAVFEAPPEYDEESLEPFLKEWDAGMELIQSMWDKETLLSSNPSAPATGEYSWRALKNYTRKVNALLQMK